MLNNLEEIKSKFDEIKLDKSRAGKKIKPLGELISSAYLLDRNVAIDMWTFLIENNDTDNSAVSRFYVTQIFTKLQSMLRTEQWLDLFNNTPYVRSKYLDLGYDMSKKSYTTRVCRIIRKAMETKNNTLAIDLIDEVFHISSVKRQSDFEHYKFYWEMIYTLSSYRLLKGKLIDNLINDVDDDYKLSILYVCKLLTMKRKKVQKIDGIEDVLYNCTHYLTDLQNDDIYGCLLDIAVVVLSKVELTSYWEELADSVKDIKEVDISLLPKGIYLIPEDHPSLITVEHDFDYKKEIIMPSDKLSNFFFSRGKYAYIKTSLLIDLLRGGKYQEYRDRVLQICSTDQKEEYIDGFQNYVGYCIPKVYEKDDKSYSIDNDEREVIRKSKTKNEILNVLASIYPELDEKSKIEYASSLVPVAEKGKCNMQILLDYGIDYTFGARDDFEQVTDSGIDNNENIESKLISIIRQMEPIFQGDIDNKIINVPTTAQIKRLTDQLGDSRSDEYELNWCSILTNSKVIAKYYFGVAFEACAFRGMVLSCLIKNHKVDEAKLLMEILLKRLDDVANTNDKLKIESEVCVTIYSTMDYYYNNIVDDSNEDHGCTSCTKADMYNICSFCNEYIVYFSGDSADSLKFKSYLSMARCGKSTEEMTKSVIEYVNNIFSEYLLLGEAPKSTEKYDNFMSCAYYLGITGQLDILDSILGSMVSVQNRTKDNMKWVALLIDAFFEYFTITELNANYTINTVIYAVNLSNRMFRFSKIIKIYASFNMSSEINLIFDTYYSRNSRDDYDDLVLDCLSDIINTSYNNNVFGYLKHAVKKLSNKISINKKMDELIEDINDHIIYLSSYEKKQMFEIARQIFSQDEYERLVLIVAEYESEDMDGEPDAIIILREQVQYLKNILIINKVNQVILELIEQRG